MIALTAESQVLTISEEDQRPFQLSIPARIPTSVRETVRDCQVVPDTACAT